VQPNWSQYRPTMQYSILIEREGSEAQLMFIAMNRFRVAKGSEAAFEQVRMSRDSHLDKVPRL
jgi:hypothetical protein